MSLRNIIISTFTLTAACASAQAAPVSFSGQSAHEATPYLTLADSARVYIADERWADAARVTREAMRLEPANPGNPMLFANLGLAAGMEGKYGEAMQAFEIALSRAPKSIPVLTSKAKIQLKAQDPDGAMETISTILGIDSLAEWPLQTRALLRMRKGEYKEAYTDFRTITKRYPDNSWGPAGLAKCMELQGYIAEAAGFYQDAVSRTVPGDEDRVEFQLGLIENLGHIGKLNEALEVAKEAISEKPHDGRLYLLRGWIKKKLLIYREAEDDKKLAIDYGVDYQTIERFFPSK